MLVSCFVSSNSIHLLLQGILLCGLHRRVLLCLLQLNLLCLHVTLVVLLVSLIRNLCISLHLAELLHGLVQERQDTISTALGVCDTGVTGVPCVRVIWELHVTAAANLHKFPGLFGDHARLLVEVLQDSDCIRECSLCILRVLDCCHDLCMILIPELCLRFHICCDRLSFLVVSRNLLDKELDGSVMLRDLCLEHRDLLILVILGLS